MANQKINALFTKGSFGRGRSSAFTIVEIITVIVVIGILASITVVSYAQITNNAKAKSVMADAAGMRTALIKYRSDHGAYPSSLDLLSSPPATTSSFQYSYDATAGTFCITASVNGASAYADSTTQQAKSGGCPGHGVNGQDPIKNLAINPSAESGTSGVGGYFSSPITRTSTSSAVSGSYIFSTTTNSTTNRQGFVMNIGPSAEGKVYSCSISLRGSSGVSIIVSGRAGTSAAGYVGEGYGNKTITLSSSWQRVSITMTMPANTGIAYVQSVISSAQSGVLVEADALMCVEGTTQYPFADGNTTNWVWDGATNNSSSTGPALQ